MSGPRRRVPDMPAMRALTLPAGLCNPKNSRELTPRVQYLLDSHRARGEMSYTQVQAITDTLAELSETSLKRRKITPGSVKRQMWNHRSDLEAGLFPVDGRWGVTSSELTTAVATFQGIAGAGAGIRLQGAQKALNAVVKSKEFRNRNALALLRRHPDISTRTVKSISKERNRESNLQGVIDESKHWVELGLEAAPDSCIFVADSASIGKTRAGELKIITTKGKKGNVELASDSIYGEWYSMASTNGDVVMDAAIAVFFQMRTHLFKTHAGRI